MKVAIYCRVSREDLNLDNQMLPLIAYCKMRGWEYEVFTEKESTRKTRPIQNKLYQEGLKGLWKGILIYKFDRWARTATELILHSQDLIKSNCPLISYSENVDPSTSYGKAFFGMLAVMAEFERDLIRERTIAGLERAKAQGKKLGRPKKNTPL